MLGLVFSLSWSSLPPRCAALQFSVTKAVRHPSSFHTDALYDILPTFLSSPPQNSQSEEEEDVFGIPRRRSSLGLSGYPLTEEEAGTRELGSGGPLHRALRRIISIEEDPLPQLLDGGFEQPLSRRAEEGEASGPAVEEPAQQARPVDPTPASPRGQPVGKEDLSKVGHIPRRLADITPVPVLCI